MELGEQDRDRREASDERLSGQGPGRAVFRLGPLGALQCGSPPRFSPPEPKGRTTGQPLADNGVSASLRAQRAVRGHTG